MPNASPNKDQKWIGQKFHSLTVIGMSTTNKNTVIWKCLCDCGRETCGQPSVVRGGGTKQCKTCARRNSGYTTHPKIKEGDRVGNLTVIRREENGKWLCGCDCGGSIEMEAKRIFRVKIAGCSDCSAERKKLGIVTHGDRVSIKNGVRPCATKLYGVWYSMRTRCRSPLSNVYKNYGGKGIKVCDEGQDFAIFRLWAMSHGYKEGLSIDRMDSSGNYEPANCEWVTRSENSRRVHHPKIGISARAKKSLEITNNHIIGLLGMAA